MKKIITIALLCFLAFAANAQRHIKGIKAIDLLGGVTGKGFYGEGGYTQYISNKFYLNGRLRYETGKLNDSLTFNAYSFSAAGNYTLWSPGEGFFLNGTFGASFIYNTLGKESFEKVQYTIEDQNTWTFGPFVGAETEVFLGNRVVWLVNFRENYNIKNDLGRWTFYAGTGLRINIY